MTASTPASYTELETNGQNFAETESHLTWQKVQQLLWPRPQCLSLQEGSPLVLPKHLSVRFLPSSGRGTDGEISVLLRSWNRKNELLSGLGYSLNYQYLTVDDTPSSVTCAINRDVFSKEESYLLTVDGNGVHLSAADVSGLNYGVGTLIQLIVVFKDQPGIPLLQIRDWPSLRHRALKVVVTAKSMRVLKIETLRALVETWAKLNLNQLHLHCILEPGEQWQISYTSMEMFELERLCNECGIALVPSLDLETDDDLSLPQILVAIKVFLQSFRSLRFIALGELLLKALTSSGQNLEDFLPFALSRVTLILPSSFITNVSSAFKLQCVELTTVSEIVESSSQLKLSSQCLLLNPMHQSSMCRFDQKRIFDVCSWVQKAYSQNHLGVIVDPHTECSCTMPVAFLAPVLLALGLTWNHNAHVNPTDLAGHINCHLLCDTEGFLGQVLMDLGSVEFHAPVLWNLLEEPDSADIEIYTGNVFQRAVRQLQNCQLQLHKMDVGFHGGEEIQAEILLLIDLLIFAARIGKHLVSVGTNPHSNYGVSVINVGIANLPPTAKTDLANKLLGLIKELRAVWTIRYVPNSVDTTLVKLNNLFNHLVPPDNVNII